MTSCLNSIVSGLVIMNKSDYKNKMLSTFSVQRKFMADFEFNGGEA